MKKILTLLTAILLCSSVMVQAQLLGAINDTPEGGTIPPEANLISGRNNAPMATYETSFTWDELYAITNPESGSNWTRCNMVWYRNKNTNSRPALRLVFVVRNSDHLTINNMYAPQYGTYTFSDDQPTFNTCYNAWTNSESLFYPTSDKTYYLVTGTVTVSEGSGGKPYIVVETTENANTYGNIVSSGTYITSKFTIGSPKQYTITVNKTPAAGGTVTGGGTRNAGASTTIVATPDYANGYVFDKWQKDGVDFVGNTATSITLTVSAETEGTYTANFKQATDGTIAGLSNNDSYGSVIVNQSSTAGGTAVTLTPIANDGYAFLQWSDGNTDNPRTVYVDGNHEYTAQFVFGVAIDVQAAMTGNSGFDDYVYKYWAKTKDYDIHIIGSSGEYTENKDFDISFVNTSASRIIDHGVTVTLTNDFAGHFHTVSGKQVLDATVTGSNGKKYILTLRGKNVGDGNLSVGYSNNFDQTYSSMSVKSDKGNGIWRISGQNGTGETYSTTWCSHFFFATDQNKCGDVPSGYYQVDDNGSVGTLITTDNSSNQSYGSYYVQSYVYYDLATGYAEVVNRDETYYIRFEGYHYRGYTHTAQIGTTPYTLNATASANGHTNLVWHSANCGDVTYTAAEMPQKFFNGNTVTFNAVANEGYEFWRWSDEASNVETSAYGATRDVTVSGNTTLQAIFRQATAKHTVTFYDYDGTTELQTGDVEEGTQPTYNSETAPTRADDNENNLSYEFAGWRSSEDGQVYTAELPNATTEVTYTAVYDEYFRLWDDRNQNALYYRDTLANMVDGDTHNIKFMRVFPAGEWAAFSLPFNYIYYQHDENQTFRDQVYQLVSSVYEEKGGKGYLTLNCMPSKRNIVANKPYILIPTDTIKYPVFKNVNLQDIADKHYKVNDMKGTGSVTFYNTQYRQQISNTEDADANKRTIYLRNSILYYPKPNAVTYMRAFRGYFYMNEDYTDLYHSPARIRLVNEEGESIETLPEAEEETSVETKKYIENGILVIERAGIKYDAQGHKLN